MRGIWARFGVMVEIPVELGVSIQFASVLTGRIRDDGRSPLRGINR